MKHSLFCPYNFLVFILCTAFLVSAKSNKHFGGKAVKADLVAIFSQLKKVAESRSFQNDLAQLVKKHTAKLDLKKEQLKDLKEFLTIFNQFMEIDRKQLMFEQHEYLQKENELYQRQVIDDLSQQELELLLPALEKGQLIVKKDNLWQQFNSKFTVSDLEDALKEVFGDQYDMGLIDAFSMVGSDAARAAIGIIDRKLDYQKKKEF